MSTLMSNVSELAGKDEDYMHPFFLKAKEMIDAGDQDALIKDKLALKLLRLTN
jgi:hypothetical protein